MKLEEYAEQILQETLAAAEVDGVPRLEAFTQLVIERLSAAGEFDTGQVAYHRKIGVEVSGWAHDPDRGVFHAFVTNWSGRTPPKSLTSGTVTQSVKRLVTFLEKCASGYAGRLEESDDVWELADFVGRERSSFTEIRLYVFSDAVARRTIAPEVPSVFDVPSGVQLWDLERLFRLDTSGLEREPISVRIADFQSEPLPVLEGPSGGDHRVYMAILPSRLVADLYAIYGSRLLERNVRSFLQARGAVNRGIRETILNEPGRFLAYNNGISATAADVSVVECGSSGIALTEIKDLQIVNGGQTTASLHHAATRDRADLNGIAVQAKLTVVQSALIDEIVPYISKYSNTQNKVTGADFSANHPFHVKVEELSRTVWAPAPNGSQKQTRWFYERARGQYADEVTRAGTPARQRQFKMTCPTTQKFTKTDLGKFFHTWSELPHVVSLGAEKNFREFMLRLEEQRIDPDVEWFQRLIATGILFRTAERVVQRQRFGGYRAQIVTYTLAKLANATEHRVDLDAIWRQQRLSEATSSAIAELSHPVHDVVTQPSGRVRHVGEWAKKLDCWKAVEEIRWSPPRELAAELIELGRRTAPKWSALAGGLTPTETALIAEVQGIPAEAWFAVSHWAKETNSLQGWQRSLAFSIGRLLANHHEPSIKQAKQGKKLYEDATRLGFRP
jgi:hypothetical protein